MSHWEDIRLLAVQYHASASALVGDAHDAQSMLAGASQLTGLTCYAVPRDHGLLQGAIAVLDRDGQAIWYANQPAWQGIFAQAHEFAHHWLGREHGLCTSIDPESADDDQPAAHVEGYGPEERREREANVFALEFLLPTHLLRSWLMERRWSSQQISRYVKLPHPLVTLQTARALLMPAVQSDQPPPAPPRMNTRNALQQAAATVQTGPVLLDAGPGTGKTETLAARIAWLIEQGTSPMSILALTFSNKAADELRERVASALDSNAAQALWTGTFHAFAMDLLRQYGGSGYVPVSASFSLLDTTDSLLLLQDIIATLPLHHYARAGTTRHLLSALLSAIQRAKDELVPPARYAELANGQGKSAEIALVYTRYQEVLQQRGLLDYGDLIMQATILLEAHPRVRQSVQEKYPHVLVDEYQDINRASGVLLRHIAGSGAGLWVVADMRQTIYRFRGASEANIRLFTSDFPHAQKLSLRQSYRSRPTLVALFNHFAHTMPTVNEHDLPDWQAVRDDQGPALLYTQERTTRDEMLALTRRVEQLRNSGVAYGKQAVLCRTHKGVALIVTALENANIPVLALGTLITRPEVMDMLALLRLTAKRARLPDLKRICQLPEYRLSAADLLALDRLRQPGIALGDTMLLAASTHLSAGGQEAMARLLRHLAPKGARPTPWLFLSTYLFVRSEYLRPLLRSTSVRSQQQKAALFVFLRFTRDWARAHKPADGSVIGAFLDYVEWMQKYSTIQDRFSLPEWAENLDAVHVLTVHGSKGLEFSAVHIPQIQPGIFPTNQWPDPCPPPPGLVAATPDDHNDAEEQSVFFVAMSRARDYLALSHSADDSAQSPFLQCLLPILPTTP